MISVVDVDDDVFVDHGVDIVDVVDVVGDC